MNPPKVAAVLLVAVIALTLLNFLLKYYTYLVLVMAAHQEEADESAVPHPHELYVPFLTFIPAVSAVVSRPWVLITSVLIQDLIVLLAPVVLVILYVGSFVESRWGLREFLRFVTVVAVASSVAIYAYYSIKCLITNTDSVPPVVASAAAVVVGLLVAAKQRLAQHYVLLFNGTIRIKVTYVPFLMLVVVTAMRLVDLAYAAAFFFTLVGFGTSWVYLRYLQPPASERQSYLLPFTRGDSPFDSHSVRGDRSDLFALVTFFPGPVAFPVHVLGAHLFQFMVRHNWVDPADYSTRNEHEDVAPVQSRLIGLSALKGAGDVAPLLVGSLGSWFGWGAAPSKPVDIKDSMDKRRKLAIRELE